MEIIFLVFLVFFNGFIAYSCFKIGASAGNFWGWLNLVASATSAAQVALKIF